MATNKPRRLKWFFLSALVLSAIIFYGWSARKNYEVKLRQQIWPATAPEIFAALQPTTGKKPTVLFFGDSRVAQWRLPELAHWRVVNAGSGGLTTSQVLASAPKLLEEFRPEAVVLEAGINDIKFIGLRPDLAAEIISLSISNLTAVIAECGRPHCPIIVLKIWPPSAPSLARRLIWNEKIPDSVAVVNRQLEQLNSPGQGIRVVDLFARAGINFSPELYADTLHFTPEVYARLTPVLKSELDALRAMH